jgi:hypothetical protein
MQTRKKKFIIRKEIYAEDLLAALKKEKEAAIVEVYEDIQGNVSQPTRMGYKSHSQNDDSYSD